MVELLEELDTSGDGAITTDEFDAGLQKHDIQQFISALEIDIEQAQQLFFLLDQDTDGLVDIVEFVEGMQKLRGEAKRSDVYMMNVQINSMIKVIDKLFADVEDVLQRVR